MSARNRRIAPTTRRAALPPERPPFPTDGGIVAKLDWMANYGSPESVRLKAITELRQLAERERDRKEERERAEREQREQERHEDPLEVAVRREVQELSDETLDREMDTLVLTIVQGVLDGDEQLTQRYCQTARSLQVAIDRAAAADYTPAEVLMRAQQIADSMVAQERDGEEAEDSVAPPKPSLHGPHAPLTAPQAFPPAGIEPDAGFRPRRVRW